MKPLMINLLLLVFTTQQAIAYAPNINDRLLLKEMESVVEDFGMPGASEVLSGHKLSFKQYKKQKRKSIKRINKVIKKLYKLTPESQVNHVVNLRIKDQKKIVRTSKKILRNINLMEMIAKKKNLTRSEARGLIRSKVNEFDSALYRIRIEQVVSEYGSYINYLKENRKELIDLRYNDYSKKQTYSKSIKRIPILSSLYEAFIVFWVLIFILILIKDDSKSTQNLGF